MAGARREVSAGGVVARRRAAGQGGADGAGAIEVALIRPAGRGPGDGERGAAKATWCLPKGLVAPGETPEAAALREVREETGLTAAVLHAFEPISYVYVDKWHDPGCRVFKKVHFFLMRATGGDPRDHDHEVDEVRFFPLPDAEKVASYRGERALLRSLARGEAGEAAARALATVASAPSA